ncbi:hypothetical protein CPB85DRAFT_1027164 [Mucidula mucida]|nr:hypothetical protein CPB85DRAFT_1027164 [Mucidula mucida]
MSFPDSPSSWPLRERYPADTAHMPEDGLLCQDVVSSELYPPPDAQLYSSRVAPPHSYYNPEMYPSYTTSPYSSHTAQPSSSHTAQSSSLHSTHWSASYSAQPYSLHTTQSSSSLHTTQLSSSPTNQQHPSYSTHSSHDNQAYSSHATPLYSSQANPLHSSHATNAYTSLPVSAERTPETHSFPQDPSSIPFADDSPMTDPPANEQVDSDRQSKEDDDESDRESTSSDSESESESEDHPLPADAARWISMPPTQFDREYPGGNPFVIKELSEVDPECASYFALDERAQYRISIIFCTVQQVLFTGEEVWDIHRDITWGVLVFAQ